MKRSILLCTALLALAACKPADNGSTNQGHHGGRVTFREACQQDMDKYCAGKEHRDLRRCLFANQDKLTPDCKAGIERVRARMQERRKQRQQMQNASPSTGQIPGALPPQQPQPQKN